MGAVRQMQWSEVDSENAVVVGLGRIGLSCASHLIRNGYDVEIADPRKNPPLERVLQSELPGVPLHKEKIDSRIFLNANLIVLTGCVSDNQKIVRMANQYGCEVVNCMELFARSVKRPVALIAGNNGKTSVSALVKEAIVQQGGRVRVGGPSDAPVLDMLNGTKPDVYLIEVPAMSALEQTWSLSCDVVAYLNGELLTGNEKKSTSAQHGKAFERVLSAAKRVVLPADGAERRPFRSCKSQARFGGCAEDGRDSDFGIAASGEDRWLVRGESRLCRMSEFHLRGAHNERNIMAALAILEGLGYDAETVLPALRGFQGLPYCCSPIGEFGDDVGWINDSKSTNLSASIAAVNASEKPVVLIAGGVSRSGDFSPLARRVNGNLIGAVLFGRDGEQIQASLQDVTETVYAESIFDAISAAAEMANKNGGDVVFSPGCAPFDLFVDHVLRGQFFTNAVRMHYS